MIADKPEYEDAREIAKAIIADLEEHRGIPSDEMKGLRPFQQYERALSGRDHVWCGNIAAIFSQACNSLGIPCRRIAMQRPFDESKYKSSLRNYLKMEQRFRFFAAD